MYRDVLLAIDGESSRRRENARVGGKLPEKLACRGVKRVDLAIVGAAAENHAPAGCQHGAPVWTLRIVVLPCQLSGVDVPGLDLAEVVGARHDIARLELHSGVSFARRILYFHPGRCAAYVVVGRNVNHACLWTERDGRPVFAAMQFRAIGRMLSGTWLVGRVHIRPARFGIDPAEHVLVDVRLALDEFDTSAGCRVATIQEPEVAVARHIDQTFEGAPVALEINQDGW